MRPAGLRPWLTAAALAWVCAPAAWGQACGPFLDVPANDPFCPAIRQLYVMGLTAGIDPGVSFGPLAPVTRQVLAAILARADRPLGASPGSRRAALGRFWTTQGTQYAVPQAYGLTTVGDGPTAVKSDGVDLWVANQFGNSVTRVRASDGAVLETWTGIPTPQAVLVALGRVFAVSAAAPSHLYEIDPRSSAPAVSIATLPNYAASMAFDGARIWTANSSGTVSIVTPGAPWTVATVSGFSQPNALLFDGANVWVTDIIAGTLLKLDAAGAVLQTVTVGAGAGRPAFDGANIWLPIGTNPGHILVVRAASGAILADLANNVPSNPLAAAFDGERILVTHFYLGAVSLWNAADRSFLGQFSVSTGLSSFPSGACSDGIDFWVTLSQDDRLARF